MNALVQSSIVLVIVAIATGYASLKFMPATWRRGLAGWAARQVARTGMSEVTARRVEAKLSTGGACGSCDTCRACAAPAASMEAEGDAASATGRRIPIRSVR